MKASWKKVEKNKFAAPLFLFVNVFSLIPDESLDVTDVIAKANENIGIVLNLPLTLWSQRFPIIKNEEIRIWFFLPFFFLLQNEELSTVTLPFLESETQTPAPPRDANGLNLENMYTFL